MKIRNGFVSNSSSSSFIIQVNADSEKCPTCGHTPESVIDLVQRLDNYGGSCDDSSVDTIDEYIADRLECEIASTKNYIAELEKRDPDEITHPNIPHATMTVKHSIECCEEELAEYETEIAKYRQLEAEGKKLYHLQVSYHDNLVQHILDENVAAGLVTILEGE